jgi:hypothetical protein
LRGLAVVIDHVLMMRGGGEGGGDGVRRAAQTLRLPIMGTAGGMWHSTQQVPNLHKLENSLATAPDVDLLKVE